MLMILDQFMVCKSSILPEVDSTTYPRNFN
jgi:hypothetical protein